MALNIRESNNNGNNDFEEKGQDSSVPNRVRFNVSSDKMDVLPSESVPLRTVNEREEKAEDKLIKSAKKWLVLALSIMMFVILLIQTFKQSQTLNPTPQSDQLSKLINNLLTILNGGVPSIGAAHVIGSPNQPSYVMNNETNSG